MMHMKRTITMTWMAVVLLLLGVGAASAQSLGDYARSVRKDKDKSDTSAAGRHYDNDNLPTNQKLSVVGPEPGPSATSGPATPAAAPPAAADAKAAEEQRAKNELQTQIDAQKEKVDSLTHDLDAEQREYRMRVIEFYSNPAEQKRLASKWGTDDSKYKSDLETKQKDIEAARQELEKLQEQGRKSGLKEKDDAGTGSGDKGTGK